MKNAMRPMKALLAKAAKIWPLIKSLHGDAFFNVFPTAREEEAVGIVSGAWMGGMRGAMLMQTSGFATLANVLASLVVPSQIPLILSVPSAHPPATVEVISAKTCALLLLRATPTPESMLRRNKMTSVP